jgi:hypothetical protein
MFDRAVRFCFVFVTSSVVVVVLLLFSSHLPSGSLLTKCYCAGDHIASVGIVLTSGLDFSVHHARTRTVHCNRPGSVQPYLLFHSLLPLHLKRETTANRSMCLNYI